MSATAFPNGIPDVQGKRALVYSLGMEGRDLAGWLLRHGASVTISDTRTPAQLQAAGATAPEGIDALVTGQALLPPDGFDLLAVSQSVLRHDPAVARARALRIPVISQMQLFLRVCPGRVIGITGSSGKSTTTALVGAMAREAGIDHVVGGNIGEALLGRADDISANTTVVLEISHTQLQYTDRAPHLAAVTNVTPNHLDQFSWDEYVGLKRHILEGQGAEDQAVLNADDLTSRAFVVSVNGRLSRTSVKGEVPGDGAWLDRGVIVARRGREKRDIIDRTAIRLRGEHNIENVVMACAIADAAGWPLDAVRRAATAFRGVPHRLEVVGRSAGVTWVNDSIATSPERTVAGLRAFTEPVVLLLGGREKHLPMDRLQELGRERCRAVICFGEAAQFFADAMAPVVPQCTVVSTLPDAVSAAAAAARPGDVVLLSPAGTSFDAYPSFEVRGQAFRELVRALPGFEEVPS
jgi:UDP-N-acetylmuramoylalanine--D-glutamate ligase